MAKSNVVDLSDLYPATTKYMVYQHQGCCQLWIELQLNVNELRLCPLCQKFQTAAIAAFAKKEDAVEYREHLLAKIERERFEFQMVRFLNRTIDICPNTRIGEYVNRTKITPSGHFMNRWTETVEKDTFPQPEMLGFNAFRNAILQPTDIWGPRPNESFIRTDIKK